MTSVAAKVFITTVCPGVVDRLLKEGMAQISEDAVCVFFPDIPELADKPMIIRKRDGGFNYATTDIATVDYRVAELKARHCSGMLSARRRLCISNRSSRSHAAKVTRPISATSLWQHSGRKPKADEDAIGRKCSAARSAGGSDHAGAKNHRRKKSRAN